MNRLLTNVNKLPIIAKHISSKFKLNQEADLQSRYTLKCKFNSCSIHKFINEVKNDVKVSIQYDESKKILDHVKSLVKQGHFLELTKLELTDATWKSFIFNLPKGKLLFVNIPIILIRSGNKCVIHFSDVE